MREVLPEADPRVDQDPLGGDPRINGRVDALGKEGADVLHHVVVGRVLLHRLRTPLHVHQRDEAVRLRDDLGHSHVAPKCADVVHQDRSGGESRLCDDRLRRVDRDENIASLAERTYHRKDARRLFLGGDHVRPRPRRFSADVDDIGSGRFHPKGRLDGFGRTLEAAAVVEGVRSYVEDPHHQDPTAAVHPLGESVHRRSIACLFVPAESRFDGPLGPVYNPGSAQIGVIAIAKVLLTKTVENVGHVGEVIDVADGFARNYLVPRGLAVEPTEHNMGRYAKAKEAHEAELLEREGKARLLRDKLADQTLVFVRKAHDDDRLYGSVRIEDITTRIEELLGEHIESSRVLLERPIETLGPHSVTIGLYKDIAVDLRVRVDAEGKPAPEATEDPQEEASEE